MHEASFFGEIVSVPSRRFDEDDDEEEEEKISSLKRSYKMECMISNPQTLIVAVDKLSEAFTKVYLLPPSNDNDNNNNVGAIWEETEKKGDKKVNRVKKCAFHKINDDVLVAHAIGPDPFYINQFVSQMLELKPDKVIILKSEHISNYRVATTEDEPDSVLSRVVMTSVHSDVLNFNVPKLEQPNFISGIAAAVLSKCEFASIKAVILITYSDSLEPDSISLSGFLPIFKFESLKRRPEAQDRIRKLANDGTKTDQIYL